MIYLEEKLDLTPATPETMDTFIELAQKTFVPACQRLGAHLVAAWSSDVFQFCQVTQVLEFNDMEALKFFRCKASQYPGWGEYTANLEELAPERHTRLLVPFGPVSPDALHEAIAQSQQSPLGIYSLAVLEMAADKVSEFKALLVESAKSLPIIASWRPAALNPNQVIDLWKGVPSSRPGGVYQQADEEMKPVFRALREQAPRESLITVYTLPYSPLQ
jgi:hypothetical protein